MSEKEYLSWGDYNALVDRLILKVPNIEKYEYICGVPRGGLLLSLIMSYKLNIPVITPSEISNLVYIDHLDHKSILVVDDIIDSGKTLVKFVEAGFPIATIYKQEKCTIKPDWFVESNTNWIVFPYETEEDSLSSVNIENIQERRDN